MKTDTRHSPPANPITVTAALFAVYVVWGSTYLAIRFAVEGIPPLLMSGIRFLIAGGAMYSWLRRRGVANPTREQWVALAKIGGLMLVGGVGVVAVAENVGVGSGVAATAIAAVPLWTAFWARVFGERTTRREAVGLAVGFVGVAVLAAAGDLAVHPLGTLLILLAPISWAFGSIWSKRLDLPTGAMATAAQMLTGGAMLIVVGVAGGERITEMPGASSWLALGYLIVFGSMLAYTSYMFLLRTVRPALATSYAYVNPVVAVVLGVTLGSEIVTTQSLASLPIILVGVGLLAGGRSGVAVRRRDSIPVVESQEAPCPTC